MRFIVRLLREDDALALLECYTDPLAWPIFNCDGSPMKYRFHYLPEMETCIDYWMLDYEKRASIRFGIVDRERDKAIGTIGFSARPGVTPGYGKVGLLRLDLPSRYENESAIMEIMQLAGAHFYGLFGVDSIITKAIPEAKERIAALEKIGYQALPPKAIVPFADYFVGKKPATGL